MVGKVSVHARPRPVEDAAPPRSRVRRALVCPYCRDEVGRSDAVACARRACGALYHRACWSECAGHYGGCAIWGCGSERAAEVSALGYALFLVKLVLAALFLPPSVARRVSEASAESLPGVAVRAFRTCRKVLPDRWTVGGAALLLGITVAGCIAADLARESHRTFRSDFVVPVVGALVLSSLGALAWTLVVVWFVPFLAVVVALACRSLVRLVAFAFRGQLPALARADGGLSVLARLGRGPAAKPG